MHIRHISSHDDGDIANKQEYNNQLIATINYA